MRALVLVLLASPATAAIMPCYLDEMVADAVTVIQVVDQTVTGPDAEGTCGIEGNAARVLRGTVREVAPFRAAFACENPRQLVGGTIYHDRRAVARAGAVELHLDADGLLAGYGWGLVLLDAPTDAPAFRFEHLPEGGSC